MYSQIPRQDGLDQNQPSGMEGQEDQQPGKRSVFINKVKAKARKIKDALKKKDDNADQDNNDETIEGHEEEDDEMVEDSEVHESVPVTNTVAGQNPGGNLEKPTVAAENRDDSKYQDPQTRPFSQPQDEDTGKYGGSTGRSTAVGVADVHVPEKSDDSFSPSAGTLGTPGSESAGNFVPGEGAAHTGERPKISMETPTCTEEDPPAPKDGPEVSNYLTKIDDPTGADGEEAGITGMRHSFDKMNVYDEPESKPKSEQAPELYTESQDQSSPEPIPPQSTTNANDTEAAPVDNVTKLPSNQSGYTSSISDKAIAAKNAVAWKLGYGGNQDETASSGTLYTQEQGGEGEEGEKQQPVAIVTEFEEESELLGSDEDPKREMTETEYKIDDKTNTFWFSTSNTEKQEGEGEEGEKQQPVAIVTEFEEVIVLVGSDEDPKREMTETEYKIDGGEDAGITGMSESFNKTNVYDEPESKPKSEEAPELYTDSQDKFSQEPIPPQSTINPNDTEDVPLDNVTKLPSNQNVVASKLGQDGNQDETAASDALDTRKQGGEGEEGEDQKPAGIVTESEEVKERLGSNEDPNNREKTESESKIDSSVKDTLFTQKQGEEGDKGENQKPAGIVTESEEARDRLGSDEDPNNREKTETESKVASNVSPSGSNVSPTGKGYVESVKDSVTSWWSGGGAQKQDSEASPGKTHGEGERLSSSTGEAAAAAGDGEKGVGERRLQESGN